MSDADLETVARRKQRDDGGWRIALLQNTPAQYHGRPEASAALTAELRALLT